MNVAREYCRRKTTMRFWVSQRAAVRKRISRRHTRRLHSKFIQIRIVTPKLTRPSRRSIKLSFVWVTPVSVQFMIKLGAKKRCDRPISNNITSNMRNTMQMTYSTCSLEEGFTEIATIGRHSSVQEGSSAKVVEKSNRILQKSCFFSLDHFSWFFCWVCSLTLLVAITLRTKCNSTSHINRRPSTPYLQQPIAFSNNTLWASMLLKSSESTLLESKM